MDQQEDFMEEQRERILSDLDAFSAEIDSILTDKLLELQPAEVS